MGGPDDCEAMATVASVCGAMLAEVLESFAMGSRECLGLRRSAPLALEVQARRADALRRHCDGRDIDAEELGVEPSQGPFTSAASANMFNAEDVLAGPRQGVWTL